MEHGGAWLLAARPKAALNLTCVLGVKENIHGRRLLLFFLGVFHVSAVL